MYQKSHSHGVNAMSEFFLELRLIACTGYARSLGLARSFDFLTHSHDSFPTTQLFDRPKVLIN